MISKTSFLNCVRPFNRKNRPMSHDDARWMRLALSLGARGLGRVWPNPAVGCVIVKEGRVLGRGWTQDGGRPHAEPMALAEAGEAARGATAYVTLEPCAHHGKTPPCCDALIAAGVARVVSAIEDPDPRVDGGGHARLKAAGMDVRTGVLAADAAEAQKGFLSRITRSRPMLTLKLATSFDGRIATATGESMWITGPEARRLTHMMRARHDAVMVGAGTARDDDPSLTVRGMGEMPQPVRVVVSRNLAIPQDSVLAKTARDIPVWLITSKEAPADRRQFWQDQGARCLIADLGPSGQIDPDSTLSLLGQEGLTRVFCEGGGALAASLLNAGLVDDLAVFTAGMAIGAEGRPAIAAMGLAKLTEAPRFTLTQTRQIGADTLQMWRSET